MNSRNEKQTVLELMGNPQTLEEFGRKQTDKDLLEIIALKNHQINILHQINTRLGVELSILQRKLGMDPDHIIEQLENLNELSVAFHYETGQLQYLDSLLQCYDDTLLKQKKTIALLYSALQDGEKKGENLVRDNEYLLIQNQNKCKKIIEIYQRGAPEDSLVPSYSLLQREMEAERMDTIREENQYLLQHSKSLEDTVAQLEVECQTAKAAAEKYFQSYKMQAEELKAALIKVDDLLKIKQVLERKYDETAEENIRLETIKDHCEARVSKLEGDNKALKAQLFSLKKTAREDAEKASLEGDSIRTESEGAVKRERDTFGKLMALEKQIETLKDSNRNYKREIEKVKGEFEQTLHMCETYQAKIAACARKEESGKLLIEENKRKMDEIVLEKEKMALKAEQLEKFIQNMTRNHREQVAALKATYEKITGSLNGKLGEMEEQREEMEAMIGHSELALKSQMEKLKRENSNLREEKQRFITNIKSSSGSQIISKLRQLEERNEGLSKVLSQRERSAKEEREQNEQIIRNYESEKREYERIAEKERNNASAAVREASQLRARVGLLEGEKECLEVEVSRLRKNGVERSQVEEKEWLMRELQAKLAEAVQKERTTRVKAIEMLEKYDEAEERLKGEYQQRILQLEGENAKLKLKRK